MTPKSEHTSVFPNLATGISPSTHLFMLETWESILTPFYSSLLMQSLTGFYFSLLMQSLTGYYLLELFHIILRMFYFFPYPQMPSIHPSHYHLLLDYYGFLFGFPTYSSIPLQFIFHVSTRIIFHSYCSGFRGQFHLCTHIFLQPWNISSFHFCKYCSSIILFILST